MRADNCPHQTTYCCGCVLKDGKKCAIDENCPWPGNSFFTIKNRRQGDHGGAAEESFDAILQLSTEFENAKILATPLTSNDKTRFSKILSAMNLDVYKEPADAKASASTAKLPDQDNVFIFLQIILNEFRKIKKISTSQEQLVLLYQFAQASGTLYSHVFLGEDHLCGICSIVAAEFESSCRHGNYFCGHCCYMEDNSSSLCDWNGNRYLQLPK
ncbi:uncharacterized protein LOC132198881 [Neocloeon triangulifer]|uniref:uncharacterized protein LOC132198881 n=1 Tax=Neocloeon triangulifer TaxID=2078957 RepID=UPI00286EEA71|nr:uncharacterized protein LOC132198881 [Neocloeon triangulifer]XP_059479140.1 uncharacterized protein LOC132198881 [Neocloeon triangulifer]XP_059479141.1 uncharacterized protein LOC132198881 [Neocloeon triangulifer]